MANSHYQYTEGGRATGKTKQLAERVVARELSLLLATLENDLGIELSESVKLVEAAVARAYRAELPSGWRCTVVPAGGGHEIP